MDNYAKFQSPAVHQTTLVHEIIQFIEFHRGTPYLAHGALFYMDAIVSATE